MILSRLTRHRRPEARLAIQVLAPRPHTRVGREAAVSTLLDRAYPREASGSGGMQGRVGTALSVRYTCVKRAGTHPKRMCVQAVDR